MFISTSSKKKPKDSFSKHRNDSFSNLNSKYRAGKSSASISKSYSKARSSFKDGSKKGSSSTKTSHYKSSAPSDPNTLNSPILTLSIGPQSRLFAAHESILLASPYFTHLLHTAFLSPLTPSSTSSSNSPNRLSLPDELPEVFSSVLEYLYKGDYSPFLLHKKARSSPHGKHGGNGGGWELDLPPSSAGLSSAEKGTTIYHPGAEQELLKDTLVYCAALRYGLPELARLSLRKQGLQTGVGVGVILGSARYAYANTTGEEGGGKQWGNSGKGLVQGPVDGGSQLRAHYLALIIRSRAVFKRSGTMQKEMERGGGGGLWFDLFVGMCNHLDDLQAMSKSPRTPRTL